MKKRTAALVTVIGSATVCVVLSTLYTYRRYISHKRKTTETCTTDDVKNTVSDESICEPTDDSVDDLHNVTEEVGSVDSCDSFDDDTNSFCSVQTSTTCSNSVTSCISSCSADADANRSPFPVGEISTYCDQFNCESPVVDFHEMLHSPVCNEITDIRMTRSPEVEHHDNYNDNDTIPDSLGGKLDIVLTYHNIVPPLKPNTGEIIPVQRS